MESINENTLEYMQKNAEEDYIGTPISVLKYISILEEMIQVNKITSNTMLANSSCKCTTVIGVYKAYECTECGKLIKGI